jgi:hypothetical protein
VVLSQGIALEARFSLWMDGWMDGHLIVAAVAARKE